MIQIVARNGSGADDLAEIVDLVGDAVMATRPNAEVDRLAVAPEDRMSVYVGRAGIAGDGARIVHRGWRGGGKSGRHRQLLDHRRAARIGNVISPGDGKNVALAGHETGVIDRAGFADDLTAQRAEVDHA